MDFAKTFPMCVCINLARRQDRRFEAWAGFEDAGLAVERFGAVDQRWVRDARGYESAGRYALALTDRLILREAERRRAPAVMLLEDDVVLHRDLAARLAGLEMPDDWGLFYLGCQHVRRPVPCGSGLVRVTGALDTQAFAVSARWYRRVREALRGTPRGAPGSTEASDQILLRLQSEIPTYAAWPNLAWQAVSPSDLLGVDYSNYHPTGDQRANWHVLEGFPAEMLGAQSWHHTSRRTRPTAPVPSAPPGRVALLFAGAGDLQHGDIWREFLAAAPGRSLVLSAHSHGTHVQDPLLRESLVPGLAPFRPGHISTVRARLALLRRALEDKDTALFALLTPDTVPVKPFRHLLRLMQSGVGLFESEPADEVAARAPERGDRFPRHPRISLKYGRFHSDVLLINRTTAEALVEDDLTSLFENARHPEEIYEGSLLSLKGFPLELHAASLPAVFEQQGAAGQVLPVAALTPPVLASLTHGPAPFARSVRSAARLADWRLHVD